MAVQVQPWLGDRDDCRFLSAANHSCTWGNTDLRVLSIDLWFRLVLRTLLWETNVSLLQKDTTLFLCKSSPCSLIHEHTDSRPICRMTYWVRADHKWHVSGHILEPGVNRCTWSWHDHWRRMLFYLWKGPIGAFIPDLHLFQTAIIEMLVLLLFSLFAVLSGHILKGQP